MSKNISIGRINYSVINGALILLTALVMTTLLMESANAQAAETIRAQNLRCEYLVNPLGINEKQPRLSWILESDQRSQKQTAYQILAASSLDNLKADKGDLWDSGKVVSSQSVHVVYEGKPMQSGQRCYWKVRAWDKNGKASAYSRPAFWEMGLLESSDWKAKWIGFLPTAAGQVSWQDCNWIWHPEGNPAVSAPVGERFFRRQAIIPEADKIAKAVFRLTADDQFELYVNGKRAGKSSGKPYAWRILCEIDVKPFLAPGANFIAVAATNSQSAAGLLGQLTVEFESGKVLAVLTDKSWKTTDKLLAGWDKPGFDDADWPNAIEVAKLGQGPWQGVEFAQMGPAPFLRKVVGISKPVKSACLYASALGVYEFHINGQKVGTDIFTPGWTDYNKRVQYQAYDVTSMLRQGRNALGVILGDGWYAGYVGLGGRNRYGTIPLVLGQLVVEYADGSIDTFATDKSWKASTGPILQSDMLMGEIYDARNDITGWDKTGFDDAQWQPVTVRDAQTKLVATRDAPVRKTQELKPIKVSEPVKGVFVFDLGQNMVGWARLKVKGAVGDKVTLRFAEMLNPDGTIYTANLRAAKCTDEYILKGGRLEVYEPFFTFHGFRYVEVTGFPGAPDADAITGVVVHSDTPRAGAFECSDPLINQLQRNIVWGQRGNFLSIPTDCPQRDERLGWTGDAQIFIGTSAYNMDVSAFFTKWTVDLEDAQSPEGAYPDVAPRVAAGEGTAAWGDAGVICPWTVYLRYGDTHILERHYGSMAKWIEYLNNHSKDLLRPAQGYGDWLSIAADTPKDVLATAYFAQSTLLMAKAAAVLGRKDDANKYKQLFNGIKTAFNKAYIAADGRIKGNTQTCYVLALAFDLLPDDKRILAAQYLVEDIKSKAGHLSTGFVGVGHLLPTLTEAGYLRVAYQLLNNDTFPSWLYSVNQGATTIWERWDGWTKEKGFQDPGMNSFNHYSLGSVGNWMYSTVAGIDIDSDKPAFEHIIIRPRPGGGLTHAKATYESIRGRIVSDWKITDDLFALNITIPANTDATVYLPVPDPASVKEGSLPASQAEGVKFLRVEDEIAIYNVGSGTYKFTAMLR